MYKLFKVDFPINIATLPQGKVVGPPIHSQHPQTATKRKNGLKKVQHSGYPHWVKVAARNQILR